MNTIVPAERFYQGSRVGVLLIHGLTGTPTEMLPVGKRLHKFGFTVYCPVLAGHCASDAALLSSGWRDWTESVKSALDRLRQETEVVFAGGLSAGAVLSLYLAGCHPVVLRGLALYSITLKWDGWSIPRLSFLLPLVLRLPYIGKRYRFAETFPYGIKNDSLRRKVAAKMLSGDAAAAGFASTPGILLRELWRLVALVKKDLPIINTPSLLVHAEEDDIASLGNALYVQRRLSGPTELLLLRDSYHMVTVDQERQKVADATARFFCRQLNVREKASLADKAELLVPELEEKPVDRDGGRVFGHFSPAEWHQAGGCLMLKALGCPQPDVHPAGFEAASGVVR